MSVVKDATDRAETEIARSPDVWFVLVQYGPCKDLRTDWWSQPLYAVQLPFDLDRFRLKDGDDEFPVMFKFRGRWYPLVGAWRQLKKLNLDAAEGRACNIVSFGRRILKPMGAKTWKARKQNDR